MERELTDRDIALAMAHHGGGFVSALAKAYLCADDVNAFRLRSEFSDLWTRYRNVAQSKAVDR
jgi:hypothetical protein